MCSLPSVSWEGRLESENGAVIHTLMRVGTKIWLLFEGGNKLYQGGNKKIVISICSLYRERSFAHDATKSSRKLSRSRTRRGRRGGVERKYGRTVKRERISSKFRLGFPFRGGSSLKSRRSPARRGCGARRSCISLTLRPSGSVRRSGRSGTDSVCVSGQARCVSIWYICFTNG